MTGNEFQEYLKKSFMILDGATGTELIKRGMPSGVCPELWVYEHPEAICDIHNAYIAAGSNIVYAPTFGGNRCKLAEFGLADRLGEIVTSLVKITKNNAGSRALVFGDIAPTGKFIEPSGELDFDEAVAIFREAAQAMKDGGADGFAIETMMDLQEARAALLGVREAAPDLPVIVTMTFESSRRTLTGNTPEAALVTLQALGADAFGCNCSTGPEEMAQVIAALKPYARIPLIAKPNAGLPRLENGKTCFSMDAKMFASYGKILADAGASIFGGCCGTTPEHIAALAGNIRDIPFQYTPAEYRSVVSSASRICEIGKKFVVIGERINPTGKKAFQAELRSGSLDMAMDFALQQSEAGAGILDVNVGLSGIDEKETMRKLVAKLCRSTGEVLCIDSTDPATVEAALRLYPGRALLNSISAEKNRLEKVLPIAAKYGAMLIALPLTDDGIPSGADGRMAAVDRIIAEAARYGYCEKDICVDALIMAVASDNQAAWSALEVISRCSERGLHTVCGLSNISFGLPERSLVNRTFLGMALGRNLSMAIANPLFPELMSMVIAADSLLGRDEKMNRLLEFSEKQKSGGTSGQISSQRSFALSPVEAVKDAVLRGDSDRIESRLQAALDAGNSPEYLLNEVMIPAITEVGKKYEEKKFFLPQLISGAEAMSRGSAFLEPLLISGGSQPEKKAKFIIATVKGDIHDIGKNIVATVLKNYGFEVIDLGKDVPPEVIIDRALAEKADLIGLSALMTTTMGAMKDTVELARRRGLTSLKFIVGGAVVDKEFADSIGAVYAADPMSAVNAAEALIAQ
ncbi:MAG: homocysteine S-methyltransferase family protein [Lentisphaeria bacterium]|nr:homocysteine S-methyltransferase family protein [Lentisphaeria bacterium]